MIKLQAKRFGLHSDLKWNFTLTMGYLYSALNNPGQGNIFRKGYELLKTWHCISAFTPTSEHETSPYKIQTLSSKKVITILKIRKLTGNPQKCKYTLTFFFWVTTPHVLVMFLAVHFKVAPLVAKPLNRSEAKGDLVIIQTMLLFKCK